MARFRRKFVRSRARNRCEYYQLLQRNSVLPHEIDHIRAKKHHGPTTNDNTCLSCARCNAAKGSNVAGYDPATGELVPLFNPRRDVWNEHFAWDGAILVGRSAVGRSYKIDVLRINLIRTALSITVGY